MVFAQKYSEALKMLNQASMLQHFDPPGLQWFTIEGAAPQEFCARRIVGAHRAGKDPREIKEDKA